MNKFRDIVKNYFIDILIVVFVFSICCSPLAFVMFLENSMLRENVGKLNLDYKELIFKLEVLRIQVNQIESLIK